MEEKDLNILALDIETAPNLAHVWQLWKQNIALNQVMENGHVLCWAAKWLDNKDIYFNGLNVSSKKLMLENIWELLDGADVVVHYNGFKFDIPTLNAEFVEVGLTPPSPYKQIDLLQTVKKQFRFPSNKLDYVSKRFGIGSKVQHEGHELWVKCMAGDEDAWERMQDYNEQDVVLLEDLYNKILPWIYGHPNPALYQDDPELQCRCGSKNFIKQGTVKLTAGRYQKYQCSDCGSWFRGSKNLIKDGGKIGRNIV